MPCALRVGVIHTMLETRRGYLENFWELVREESIVRSKKRTGGGSFGGRVVQVLKNMKYKNVGKTQYLTYSNALWYK